MNKNKVWLNSSEHFTKLVEKPYENVIPVFKQEEEYIYPDYGCCSCCECSCEEDEKE